MHAIAEVFPMLAGVLVGLMCAAVSNAKLRKVLWATLTLAFGVTATIISGEYHESWTFVLLDMLWVGGISIAIWFGFNAYRRRSF